MLKLFNSVKGKLLGNCGRKYRPANFANNEERFEEGTHFFKLDGDELKEFKSRLPENFRSAMKFAPVIMLWTRRGASRHDGYVEVIRQNPKLDSDSNNPKLDSSSGNTSIFRASDGDNQTPKLGNDHQTSILMADDFFIVGNYRKEN